MLPLTEPSTGDGSASADEMASIILPVDEPKEDTAQITLSEPAVEFPEITLPAESPDESKDQPLGIAEAPAVPQELPPKTGSQEKPGTVPEGISGPKAGASVPPAVPEKQPPSPPAHLRPAEPDEGSSVVRESLPVPINPIPELPARTHPLTEDANVIFSRTVRATVGQLVEIPFRGTGWTFLGELGSRRGISYDSRRLDPEGQSFIFRAEEAGTYALKFYKEDYIRDYIINDHVQVIVGDAPESSGTGWFKPPVDRGRVIAEPRWPLEPGTPVVSPQTPPAQTSPAAVQATPAAAAPQPVARPSISDEGIVPVTPAVPSGTPTQAGPPAAAVVMPENSSPEEYVKKAQEEFDAGRVSSAISVLEQFRQRYPSGSDEAFWLLGQFYEANSPSRDIRTSLDYYRRLVNEYPQSKRYNDAKRRIAYLERYYFNIR